MGIEEMPPLADLRHDVPLKTEQAATYLGSSTAALESWRKLKRGGGPPYIKLGDGPKARVRYLAGDLREWQAAQRVDPSARRASHSGSGQKPAAA